MAAHAFHASHTELLAGTGSAWRQLIIGGEPVRLTLIDLSPAPARVRSARAVLDQPELQRAQRVLDRARSERLLIARAALRVILAAELGVRPEDVQVVRGVGGRPVLAGEGPSFSLSHCGSWAAVAVGRHASIGVDLELGDRRISEGLLRRWLTDTEQGELSRLEAHQRGAAFLAYWTAKEACAKALGGGLGANLQRLGMLGPPSAPRPAEPTLAALQLVPLALPGQLVGALAVLA